MKKPKELKKKNTFICLSTYLLSRLHPTKRLLYIIVKPWFRIITVYLI